MERFVFAIFLVWFAIAIAPERPAPPTEILYPSHQCADGHNWYLVTSDSDSVTVRCYADPDPDQTSEPE